MAVRAAVLTLPREGKRQLALLHCAGAVTLVDLGGVNADAAWNTRGTDGAGYMALRPLTDDDANLNVAGGCGGTQIITYPWTGGNANELWRFVAK